MASTRQTRSQTRANIESPHLRTLFDPRDEDHSFPTPTSVKLLELQAEVELRRLELELAQSGVRPQPPLLRQCQ